MEDISGKPPICNGQVMLKAPEQVLDQVTAHVFLNNFDLVGQGICTMWLQSF